MTTSPLNHPRQELDRSLPIGMFDSGVGGFTVFRQLKKILPNESVVYFGDTANIPYGDKQPGLIHAWAKNIIAFLTTQRVKAIAVACNVSSSVLTEADFAESPVPVFGLIYNGATAALNVTQSNRIGILATAATVQTASYVKTIQRFSPETAVFQSACPKFVPLVERGAFSGAEVDAAVSEYTAPLRNAGVDTVIYGCTHYPFLGASIKSHLEGVHLIDPAVEIISELAAYLHNHNLLRQEGPAPDVVFASDLNGQFIDTAKLFLGIDIRPISSQVIVNPAKANS